MNSNSENSSQSNEILYDTDGVQLHRGKTDNTKEFTYKFMISVDGAPEVPLESLTDDELTAVKKDMREKLSRGMSDYYSYHPKEYMRIQE